MKFRTGDLPFAAYLFTTRKLTFLGCEVETAGHRIAFVFDDPSGEAKALHILFESGAECPAASFYDSIRHLRRVMTRLQQSNNDHGDQNVHQLEHTR